MPALKLCVECGEPCADGRCAEHRPEQPNKPSRTARGYNSAHDRMSRRARKLQPWCSGCGSKDDLQLDHSPKTWELINAGKPVKLTDYRGVYCGPCNIANGSARRTELPRGQGADAHKKAPRGMALISTQSDTEYAFPGGNHA